MFKGHDEIAALMESAKESPEGICEQKTLQIIDRINQFLNESNITRREFAQRMSVSSAAVSQFLDCSSSFNIRTLAKIAHALDVDIDWILVGDNVPRKSYPEKELVAQSSRLSGKVV